MTTKIEYDQVINVRLEPIRNHPERIMVYAINKKYNHCQLTLDFESVEHLVKNLRLIEYDARTRINYLEKKYPGIKEGE